MESAQTSILSTDDWFDLVKWESDSTLPNSPLLEELIQNHTGEAEIYGDIPIGLCLDEGQLPCKDFKAKPQTINPNIVIDGGSSETNRDSETCLGPYESGSSNKNFRIPYLENPIVDYRLDEKGRYSYLVWKSQAEMDIQAPGRVEIFWQSRKLLEEASGITQSKAICPKRRRVDEPVSY